MKKYMVLFLVLLSFSCKQTSNETDIVNDQSELTKIEFKNSTFDFGTIVQGETVTHIYYFNNTGTKPLVINGVRSSCGCTVPAYSKEPLNPGEEGYIKVTFNSSGKQGSQNKVVTVSTNTDPENTELFIKGDVTIP
ncbi:MAG: DUF1573 domain-containing protein [Bacteroidales bacterium]|nr:DUF1573 domain-containing protein [Bacteroidales bacterium]